MHPKLNFRNFISTMAAHTLLPGVKNFLHLLNYFDRTYCTLIKLLLHFSY